MVRYCAILLLLFCCPASAAARVQGREPLRFQRFTSTQGLSQNTVYCIRQDQQGFIWLGTDEGLNRFDGYSFKVYKNTPFDGSSLTSSKIYALFEDREGTLWIGTRKGLNSLDRTRKKVASYDHDLITAIYEDHRGVLWVGTTGAGLSIFDRATGRFTAYRHDAHNSATISSDKVRTIYEDRQGNLWIGTDNGLNRLDDSRARFTRYYHNSDEAGSISNNAVNAIYEDQAGNLWIGTNDGLNLYSAGQGRFVRHRLAKEKGGENSKETITEIFLDRANNLWVGSVDGLYKYQPDSGESIVYRHDPKEPASLGSNRISALFEDRSGALWVGTYFGGINKHDPLSQRFTSYLADSDITNNLLKNIWSIYIDRAGTLWIGTNDGLIELDRKSGSRQVYRHDPRDPYSLNSSHIDAILEDHTGTLWVGSNGGGLHSFDRARKRFTRYLHNPQDAFSMSSNKVRSIFEDSQGTLWIPTLGGGLNRYDRASGRFFAYRNNPADAHSISGDYARVVCEDGAGNLWVGTETGLDRFDRQSGRFTVYRYNPADPHSISSDFIIYLHIDREGTLWVATTGGLNRFDAGTGRFSAIQERDGLANNTVNGILEDDDGSLWLATNGGISLYDPKNQQIKNFDTRDGLQCSEYNGRACFRSAQGEMLFGGNNGYTSFFSAQIKENDYVPPVIITSLRLFDRTLEKAESLLADAAGSATAPLVLAHYENFLAFEFAALSYQLQERNQYAYMMVGIDNDWVEATTRRYISYSKIPPGEYIFKVKGSNSDGRWNDTGAAIRIIIKPPFWKTNLAYGCYFLFAAGSILGGIRWRLRTLRKQNLVLEKTVAERTQELAAALAEIKQNNSELDRKNRLLDEKVVELISSQRQADRIFSALADALPGTILDGKYRLEEKIGAGGFGTVYRAHHLPLNRAIAVKVFKPTPGNDSAENLERFKFEAISACRINHANAVTILDSGISADGIAYMVMELLEGHTLKTELRSAGPLWPHRCAQIIWPICQVLEKAHSLGIIHRDIKPDNIFLHQSETGEVVKILDFGIAKLMESHQNPQWEDLTATGKLIGTPAYIAPERFASLPYDGKSDIYSLGVLIYEMLSGQLPFAPGSGFLSAIQAQWQSRFVPLSEVVPGISPAISDIVSRTLALEPAARPGAGELGEQFLAALTSESDQLTVLATQPTTRWQRVEQLFMALLDADPEARQQALAASCGDEIELQQEVLSLLAAHDQVNEERFMSGFTIRTQTGSNVRVETILNCPTEVK